MIRAIPSVCKGARVFIVKEALGLVHSKIFIIKREKIVYIPLKLFSFSFSRQRQDERKKNTHG